MKATRVDFFLLPALLLFLAAVLFSVSTNTPMGNDEGMWSYMGRIWAENGLAPYTHSVENKTPGVYMLHAISYELFGTGYAFVRHLGSIASLAASLLLYRIAAKLHSHFAGVLTMLVFGLSMAWAAMDGAYTGQTETFMVFFTIVGLYFLLKNTEKDISNWSVLLCGFFLGLAIAFKQVAIVTCVPIFFWLLLFYQKQEWNFPTLKPAFLFSGGVLMATFISIVPLLLSGAGIMDYIDGAWLILLRKGSSVSMEEHLSGFATAWTSGKILIFYPFLLLVLYVFFRKKNRLYKLLAAILVFDFIAVNLSGNFYGHQFKQLLPILCLLIGISISYFIGIIRNGKIKSLVQTLTAIGIGFCFFPYLQNPRLENLKKISISEIKNPHWQKNMGKWIKERTTPDEYIYVLNYHHNQILSYSESLSSSKYFNFIFVNDPEETAEVFADLKQKPPKFIVGKLPLVIPADRIEDWIRENYEKVETVHGINIFKKM